MARLYKNKQKSHADSNWGAPERDALPIVDQKNLMSIELNKNLYGVKEALSYLDEEFKFFIPSKNSIDLFFKQYNKKFFEFSREMHNKFLSRSISYTYPEGYKNPRMLEKEGLEQDLIEIQKEIDSVEKEHFFFNNGIFIMDESFKDNPESVLSSGKDIYYMQSSKKREIKDYQTYLNLKTKLTKHSGDIEDRDFILFISTIALNNIPVGPSIHKIGDLSISNFEINIYPQTEKEYEPFKEPEYTVATNNTRT